MADLFQQAAPQGMESPAPPPKAGRAPSLHSDTEIYFAVEKLGVYLIKAVAGMPRGLKGILGEELFFHATEMADLVRLANIARGADKLPFLDELLSRLEKIKYLLRSANAAGAEYLGHRTYANSIPITDSIGKQAQGLKKAFHAPAPSPAT